MTERKVALDKARRGIDVLRRAVQVQQFVPVFGAPRAIVLDQIGGLNAASNASAFKLFAQACLDGSLAAVIDAADRAVAESSVAGDDGCLPGDLTNAGADDPAGVWSFADIPLPSSDPIRVTYVGDDLTADDLAPDRNSPGASIRASIPGYGRAPVETDEDREARRGEEVLFDLALAAAVRRKLLVARLADEFGQEPLDALLPLFDAVHRVRQFGEAFVHLDKRRVAAALAGGLEGECGQSCFGHLESPYVARVGARYVTGAISLPRRWLQRRGRVRQSAAAEQARGLSDRRGGPEASAS